MALDIFAPQVSVVAKGLEGKVIMIYGGNNLGKAQPLSEPVLTENGFKPMGSIKVGDKVYGEDGELHEVLNVFPQGIKPIYEVTFSDNTKTRCCEEHLWKVYTRKQQELNKKDGKDKHRIMELKDIMTDYKGKHSNGRNDLYKYCIPINKLIKFPEQAVKIPPYLLGALLGDGGFTTTSITFTNPENDIVEKIKKDVESLGFDFKQHKGNEIQYTIVDRKHHKANFFKNLLEEYNLVGLYSQEKFIPKEYLFNSEEVRVEILRGLLDTDGYIDDNTPVFSSTSEKLIEDIEFLVRSLGGITTRNYDRREGKESIMLRIRLNRFDIVTSKKHKDMFKKHPRNEIKKSIKNIELVGNEEAQCIQIDSLTHLYITNDFIVTHNTKQTTRMKKPLYLPFEKGLNAIAGIPFMAINSWSDFKQVNKQLVKPATLDKVKEMYNTIIFDEVEASARYCQRFVCNKYGSDTIASGNGGYGLWKEYELEYWEEINKLLGAGFTVVFIAHQVEDKNGYIYPKGDKRALAPIIDNCDIVVHVQSNGIDEEGRVIKSSGYLAQTGEYFARSRFDYIDTVIEEFTAENLEAVIIEGIERQEKAEGVKAVTFEQQKDIYASEELDYDQLMEQIKEVGMIFADNDKIEELTEIVEEHLGTGKKVSECTKKQVEVMVLILSDLKEKGQELGILG